MNSWSDFGNVFTDGLEKTTKGERYEYAKEMVLGLKPPREDIPCFNCKIYKRRVFQDYVGRLLDGEVDVKDYWKFGKGFQ